VGDGFVRQKPEGDEARPELSAALLLVLERFLKLLGGDDVLLDQELAEFDGHAFTPVTLGRIRGPL
jgi:hypothetical protein